MLIIGNTPDLFDHMPFVYGVDNKVVFDKRVYETMGQVDITNDDSLNGYSALQNYDEKYGFNRDYYINGESYDAWKYEYYKNNPNPTIKYDFMNLFYCGDIYIIAQKKVMVDGHYETLDEYYFVHEKDNPEKCYKIKANSKILEFSKKNNVPYFFYITKGQYSKLSMPKDYNGVMYVYNKYIPLRFVKLHDVVRLSDVNLMYNDIYNYMLSLKNDNDTIEVSNKDKITQAGFDLKTSFRKM